MSISIYTQTISEFCKELNPNFNTHEFWNEEMDPLYYEDAYVQSPWMKGKKHTPESIQKMRETQTGVRQTEESKRKISESLKRTFAKKKEDGIIDDRSYMKTEEYRKMQSEAQKLRYARKKLQQEKKL